METRPPCEEKCREFIVFCGCWPKYILTWLLSSQHTALAEQEEPLPTPMTVIGSQVRPTRASTSWTTIPSPFKTFAMEGSLACVIQACELLPSDDDGNSTDLAYSVAALDGRGGARAGRLVASLEGGGGRKNGESSDGEDGEAREHICIGEYCELEFEL